MTDSNTEERLAALEREMKQVRERLNIVSTEGWISRIRGQYKDDPVYDEIIRLGKETRDAESPPDFDDKEQ